MRQLCQPNEGVLRACQGLGAHRVDGTDVPEVLILLDVMHVIILFLVLSLMFLHRSLAAKYVVQILVKIVFVLEARAKLAGSLLHLLSRASLLFRYSA